MTCKDIIVDGVEDPKNCKCYRAVTRTYRDLVDDQLPEYIALQAAKRVYYFHHPEDNEEEGGITVERWVYAHRVQ